MAAGYHYKVIPNLLLYSPLLLGSFSFSYILVVEFIIFVLSFKPLMSLPDSLNFWSYKKFVSSKIPGPTKRTSWSLNFSSHD